MNKKIVSYMLLLEALYISQFFHLHFLILLLKQNSIYHDICQHNLQQNLTNLKLYLPQESLQVTLFKPGLNRRTKDTPYHHLTIDLGVTGKPPQPSDVSARKPAGISAANSFFWENPPEEEKIREGSPYYSALMQHLDSINLFRIKPSPIF